MHVLAVNNLNLARCTYKSNQLLSLLGFFHVLEMYDIIVELKFYFVFLLYR